MAAAEKKEADAPAPAAAAAPGGGSKLVLILTAVNVLATLGMIGILFISFQKDKKKPQVEDIAVQGEGGEGHEGAAAGGEHGEHGAPAGGEHGEHGGAGGLLRKKTADFGKMVTLEQFTVNLSTPGSVNPKFVRVNISLEVPTDDAETEVNSKMPQVRNAIIDLFNSKRPSDLATAEGRDYLKDEIKNALNGFMITGKVRGVFFTNFALTG